MLTSIGWNHLEIQFFFFFIYPSKVLGTGKLIITAAHNPVLCHPQFFRPPAPSLGSSHTLILAHPRSVNCKLWHKKVCGLWDCQAFERMVLLFVMGRADGAKARTEHSGLGERAGTRVAAALLARSGQLKVIVKLLPEIAEFWERINELFHAQWR